MYGPLYASHMYFTRMVSLISFLYKQVSLSSNIANRAVFTSLSKGIGFGFGFGFTTPFGWLVYLLWFWFYDSQVKTTLKVQRQVYVRCLDLPPHRWKTLDNNDHLNLVVTSSGLVKVCLGCSVSRAHKT